MFLSLSLSSFVRTGLDTNLKVEPDFVCMRTKSGNGIVMQRRKLLIKL